MVKNKKKRKNAKGSTGMNRKNSEEFFVVNRHKPGVAETASGLQYTVLEEGEGPVPGMRDTVVVNQRITLLDGTVVVDTYRSGEKGRFAVSEAILGLQEGLQLMRGGARYRFYIGPDLAWGKRGSGIKIGPHASLIFDIRLLEVIGGG